MTRLISADSHVAVSLDAIRDRVPGSQRAAFDDAIAAQARIDDDLRGGRTMSLDDFDMEAMRDPGYRDPVARLAAMDRDGVHAEVLYSEVSAFRSYGLVKGDWRAMSRAFTDHLADFAATDPSRLVVSYQVPIVEIDHAVAEVQRLAGLGARSVHLPNFPSELGLPDWIPGFLAQLDRKSDGRYRLPGVELRPSEYFRRNMSCTFMDDEIGLGMRHLVGVENILWSTDFPHPATTWPHSQEVVARQFADIPDGERDLICAGNAQRVYGL
jgi:hypothetical protein